MSNNQDMDWAAVAAKGANQSPEEARAPPVDTIIPNESASTSSLVDVDSGVSVVPPDFLEQPIKTETQATRIELEEEAQAAAAQHQQERNQHNGSGKSKKAAAKKQVKKAEGYAEAHPVRVVNTVLGTVVAVALGWGAWKKYKAGELNWRVAGIWGGAVAVVGALDMVASRFYLNKSGGH